MNTQSPRYLAATLGVVLLSGCAATAPVPALHAERIGEPIRYELDGTSDDLLTAGLGAAGLLGAPPGFVDPSHPTARELRRRAIYMNYRGLADLAPRTLALMHGPSFTGDGGAALRALADDYDRRASDRRFFVEQALAA